jgi:hypothetical protein
MTWYVPLAHQAKLKFFFSNYFCDFDPEFTGLGSQVLPVTAQPCAVAK